jgi:RNA polymerase sigma-70 factor (ECF subfamily)
VIQHDGDADARAARGAHPPGSDTPAGLRPLLFSIAYRMLGSVSEAEDMVQESYVRYEQAMRDGTPIHSPKAYLTTVVTRLAIDELRSARVRRESYVGQWLPEPLLTDDPEVADPQVHAEAAETLSMAFLLVLDRLNPVERAVFLLHDVFGYDYAEIATIIDRREDNCRQIAARARHHIEAEKPRFESSREKRNELAARFFEAVTEGDVEGLVEMLAADVVVFGDGGGKVPQWSLPIAGVARVASLLAGVGRCIGALGGRLEPREVNRQPGALVLDSEGRLVNVFCLDISEGVVLTVRSVINPDKLDHIGAVADVWALLRQQDRPRRPSK